MCYWRRAGGGREAAVEVKARPEQSGCEGCLGEYGKLLATITMGAWHDVYKTSDRVYTRSRPIAFTRSRNEPLSVCMI